MNRLMQFLSFYFAAFLTFCRIQLQGAEGSFSINVAFVQGYKNNLHMLAQQKDARVFGKGRQETQASKMDFYEVGGEVEANDVIDRHGDTPLNNAPHTRRAAVLQDKDWAELIDRLDRVRLLLDPQDYYVRAAVAAMNRKKDDIFIAAALGTARTGEDGLGTQVLTNAQKIVSVNSAGTALATLNVQALRRAMRKFDGADIESDDKRYFTFNAAQKEALLAETEITSADFNSVRALVQGEINTFLGFEFIRSERLPVTASANTAAKFSTQSVDGGADTVPAGSHRMLAFTESGMVSATGMDIFVDIGPRRDKRLSTQVYVQGSWGAVRLEEELVIEVQCLAA